MKTITAQELKKKIDDKEDFELVDVDPRPIDLRKAREAFPRI